MEKLLGVSEIDAGIGEQQANASLHALDDWSQIYRELFLALLHQTIDCTRGHAKLKFEQNMDKNHGEETELMKKLKHLPASSTSDSQTS